MYICVFTLILCNYVLINGLVVLNSYHTYVSHLRVHVIEVHEYLNHILYQQLQLVYICMYVIHVLYICTWGSPVVYHALISMLAGRKEMAEPPNTKRRKLWSQRGPILSCRGRGIFIGNRKELKCFHTWTDLEDYLWVGQSEVPCSLVECDVESDINGFA